MGCLPAHPHAPALREALFHHSPWGEWKKPHGFFGGGLASHHGGKSLQPVAQIHEPLKPGFGPWHARVCVPMKAAHARSFRRTCRRRLERDTIHRHPKRVGAVKLAKERMHVRPLPHRPQRRMPMQRHDAVAVGGLGVPGIGVAREQFASLGSVSLWLVHCLAPSPGGGRPALHRAARRAAPSGAAPARARRAHRGRRREDAPDGAHGGRDALPPRPSPRVVPAGKSTQSPVANGHAPRQANSK